MKMKGQAALDFLMTYGWALLLIVLVIATLFSLGVFDIGSFIGSRATGFSQIRVAAWRIDSNGSFTTMLANQAGTNIIVQNATWEYLGVTENNNVNTSINDGQTSSTITLGNVTGIKSSGLNYVVRLTMAYTDKATNFTYQTSGTLTGRSG